MSANRTRTAKRRSAFARVFGSFGEMARPLILIVGAHDSMRSILLSLRSSGMEPLFPRDGREALVLIDRVRPDAVLVNAEMEEFAGIGVRTFLNAISQRKASVVLVTPTGRATDLELARHSHVDSCLTDEELTLSKIETTLKRLLTA